MAGMDFTDVQTALELARRETAARGRAQRIRQALLAGGLASGTIVVIAAALLVRVM